MTDSKLKLSVGEKIGYSLCDLNERRKITK